MAQKPRTIDGLGRVQCPKCREWKYFDEYYNNKNTKLGISWQCKQCAKDYQKKFYPSAKRKRQAAKDGAALLDLQDIQGQVTLPGQVSLPEGYIEVPGYGVCKILPDDESERIRNEALAKAEEAQREAHTNDEGVYEPPETGKSVVPDGTPEAERKAYKRFRAYYKGRTTEQLRRDAGAMGAAAWNTDPSAWSMTQCALWDELQTRQEPNE